ncbi:hypothetical protein [Dyella sp.]|uniref:hypothetical protein n=1 Tax=Dyella sp. TaxID=1869338 RepID=UPI00283AE30C|nr:hypothetical protein [Dyella sp.]MDR3445956.1 hypothetical protein [Dyella sp.]
MSAHTPYLTDDQVQQLNEKHGWFEFGDAQSDVSRSFAQDAIAMHERIRSAAPDLLASVIEMRNLLNLLCGLGFDLTEGREGSIKANADAAITKATGEQA